MALTCERQIPKLNGLPDQEITVGRHVFFQCTGDWDKAFNFEQASYVFTDSTKNLVKIIKAEARSANQFDVDLVFYSSGEFKFPDLLITDGVLQLSLGEQKIFVKSVIEKTGDGKPPVPYASILPLRMSWPVNYFIIAAAILLVVVVSVIWSIRKRYRYRQLMAKMKDYESIIDPDLQFYKAIRKAELSGFKIKDLEHAFRMYLVRRYNVPAFDLKNASLLRFIKKNNPWLKKERLEIKKILEDIISVKDTDAEKKLLTQKMYLFVDNSESLHQRGAR